jgi:hypothetical protein
MKNRSAVNAVKAPLSLLGILILSSGLSCAVAPQSSPEPVATPEPVVLPAQGDGIAEAYSYFEGRDFAAAAAGFRAVADAGGSSDSDRQLAHLGLAMIHLSTDAEWRDVAEAGNALQAAEAIENGDNAGAGMLMTALSALIGAENNISELNTKVGNSSYEIAQLKEDKETMQAEQDALNEALEKLKALTIGN